MNPEKDEPTLDVPEPRATPVQANAPYRVLSLTGGGYRGLFTARLLVELCGLARRQGPVNDVFNCFAGTSIGGIMACALAVGVPPWRVVDAIDAHGPLIFKPKSQPTLRRILFGGLYDPGNLANAIDECLGSANANVRIRDVPVGLIVPAVDWMSGQTRIFMSGALGQASASDETLRDVCLATAAAPTYFDAHIVDDMPMLDGGLAANNPDILALVEVSRRASHVVSRVEMLSLGTAGAETARLPQGASRSGLGWANEIAEFMIGVQERSAAAQAAALLGSRYLRVNRASDVVHEAFMRLDLASDEARQQLMDAAIASARAAWSSHQTFIERILARNRGGSPTAFDT